VLRFRDEFVAYCGGDGSAVNVTVSVQGKAYLSTPDAVGASS
jgi:hypothetical protein